MFIIHIGYEVIIELAHHVMDGVDAQVLQNAERAALSVDGVQVAEARGRWSGQTLLIEIDAHLEPSTPIAAVARMGEVVDGALRGAVAEVRQVRFLGRPVGTAGAETHQAAEAAVP